METIEYPNGKGRTFPSFLFWFKHFGRVGANGPRINSGGHEPCPKGGGGSDPDVAAADESNRLHNRIFQHCFSGVPMIV